MNILSRVLAFDYTGKEPVRLIEIRRYHRNHETACELAQKYADANQCAVEVTTLDPEKFIKPQTTIIRSNKGAALVELVLILPLLALLFMGIVDFSLMLREHQVIQNAVREGARLSMLPQYHAALTQPINGESQKQAAVRTAETVRDIVLSYLANENVTMAKVDCTDSSGGDLRSFTCGGISIDQGYGMATSDGIMFGGSKVSLSKTKPSLLGFYGPFQMGAVSVFRNLY